jgi:[acyl-carrier-protein] S-malonyltransferase
MPHIKTRHLKTLTHQGSRYFLNTMKKIAICFPGQGSQYVGMGRSVYDNIIESKDVFNEVDETLNYKLSDIIFNGDDETLRRTNNAQPAIMCVSIAVMRAIEKELGMRLYNISSIACGHSLGEYSALCATEAISVKDTAKILQIRGRAMDEATPNGLGSMAAIIGATDEQINELISKSKGNDVLVIANDNSFGQTVISGSTSAIDRSIEVAKELGIKRAVKLPVSGAFHSPLMQKAQDIMADAINTIAISSPKIDVIANYSAEPTKNPSEIKELLVKQVTGSVRWRESIIKIQNMEFDTILEIGPGKVLSGLTKRIAPSINTISIESMDDIKAFVSLYNESNK